MSKDKTGLVKVIEKIAIKIHLKGLNIKNSLFLEYLKKFHENQLRLMPYCGRAMFAF